MRDAAALVVVEVRLPSLSAQSEARRECPRGRAAQESKLPRVVLPPVARQDEALAADGADPPQQDREAQGRRALAFRGPEDCVALTQYYNRALAPRGDALAQLTLPIIALIATIAFLVAFV